MRKTTKLALAIVVCLVLPAASFGGLISHYDFDGDLQDSVTGTTATAVGTEPATMFVEGPEGIPGQAVDLSGSGWYIDAGSSLGTSTNATGSSALTVSTWIYDNGAVGSGSDYYFGGIVMCDGFRDDTGAEDTGVWGLRRYSLQVTGYNFPGRAQMIVGEGYGHLATAADAQGYAVPAGEWVLLTATFETNGVDYSEINLYVQKDDGTGNAVMSTYTETYAEAISFDVSDKNILIGYDTERSIDKPGSANYFNGLIADVRIYDEALSASAVQGLYSVPEPSTFAMLVMGLLAGIGFIARRR